MAQFRGSDRPEITQLHSHVKREVSPNWYDLGVQLLNTEQAKKLKSIQANNPGNVEKCCTEMFNYWLQVDTNASWDKLITALQQIDYVVLADRIRAMTLEDWNGEMESNTNTNTQLSSSANNTIRYDVTATVPSNVVFEVPSTDQERELEKQSNTEMKILSSADVATQVDGTIAMPSSVESNISPTVQDNLAMSDSIAAENLDIFKDSLTIRDAYLRLISELDSILNNCRLSKLRVALIYQAGAPSGIKLNKDLSDEIRSAKSSNDLLCIVGGIPSCNWLDTRLIEALAHECGSSAIKLIDAYKTFVFAKKLNEALPSFLNKPQMNAYIDAISTKIKMDPDKITVGDVVKHQWHMENVILDLGNQTLNIEHVQSGCLEIIYHILIYCRFNAYKMALYNRYKFHMINLIHIEIGDHPPIYDPWLCDFSKRLEQMLSTQHKVSVELTYILLDNIPVDNIFKLFISYKLLMEDDLEVISFCASEYLKGQLLLKYTSHFKLSVWSVICDILYDTKLVGSQLIDVLKDKLPHTEHPKQTLDSMRQDTNAEMVSTLHGAKSIKLGFVDDSTLQNNKSHACHSRNSSLSINPFQNFKHINPSEVEIEFYYISGHVVELLSCCHPKLLIKWCENIMASEKHNIKLLPSYSVYKLRKLRTSSAILKMMSIFWSWTDHSILKYLAEFSELAVALLEDFDSRLHLDFSIAEYPISPPISSMIPYNNNNYTILMLKCNEKLQLSLQLVYDMQSVMIEKCEITEHALQLLAVQSSPLILQWMIPKHIITVINVNVRQHHQCFATKGITEILIYPYIKYCLDGNVKEFIKTRKKCDELHSAVQDNNITEIEKLIQSGVYVDSTDDEETPLYEHGHVKAVELGRTPLYVASQHGHDRAVEVLISAGANVNCIDYLGRTPLHVASEHGHYKAIEVLISAGANVNCVDHYGRTPLYVVSEHGDNKAVEVLISAGANVNCVDNYGRTPLYVASEHGHDRTVEVLMSAGANVNCVDNDGETSLHAASRGGHDKAVKVLMTAGADVNCVDKVSYYISEL